MPFEKLRRSLRGKKYKYQDPVHTESEDDYQYYPRDKNEAKQNVEDLIDFLIKISKNITKKLKKGKDGRKRPHNFYGDIETLDRYISDVKRCFYEPSINEHGKNQRYDRNRDDKDDHGGFVRSTSATPGRGKVEATVHNQEPPADYTFFNEDRRLNSNSDNQNQHENFRRSQSVEPKYRKSPHRLQEELKVREQINERLTEEIKKLKKDLDRSQKALTEETKTREDAQNRLSEMMGKQLKHNNPAITDLSDPDRPLNLVDNFSNLYDNEWTDMIEDIEQITGDEKTATKILLTVVTDTYKECYNIRHNSDYIIGCQNRSTTILHRVKDLSDDSNVLLKRMKTEELQPLKQIILDSLQKVVDRKVLVCFTTTKKQYLTKCLEICWKMVCHSPPLYMEWNYRGQAFDTHILKPFTETGEIVDFMVWPVIFLHKNGPLLSKGVGQGKSRSNQTSF